MANVRSEYTIGVRDEVSGPVARMSASLGKFASTIAGLGALGAAGGIAVVATRLRSAVDMADELNKASQKAGTTVERLSALQYAARLADVSSESLTAALAKLSRQMDQAAQGVKAPAAAFDAIGVAVKNADGSLRDSTEVLTDVARVFATLPDGATKTALAIQLFGRAGAELIPLLNSGADGIKDLTGEAEKLGVVMSKELAQQSEDLKDNMERLAVAADGLGIALASKVVPALNDVVDAFKRGNEQGGLFDATIESLREAYSKLFPDFLETRTESIQNRIEALRDEIDRLQGKGAIGQASAWFNSVLGKDNVVAGRILKARLEIVALQEELKALQDVGNVTAGAAAPSGANPQASAAREAKIRAALEGQAASEAAAKEADRLAKAQDEYLARLREAVAVQGEATELAKVEADIKFGAAAKFAPAVQAEARALAENLDIVKDTAEVHEYLNGLVRERAKLDEEAATKLAGRRQAVIDSLMTPLEEYTAKVRELIDLGFEGDTLARGIVKAKTELDAAQKKATDLSDAAKDLGLTFSSAFEDAVIGGKGLREVLDGIGQDIARIFLRKAVTEPAANLFSGLLQNIFPAGGAGGGGGGFFNFAALGFGGGKAAGGPVSPGKYYMVGERGPELFAPGMSGNIIPNGGGLKVVINNYSGERVTARESGDGRRELEITVGNLLAGNVRAGRGSNAGLKPALASR